jgi:hypothetical protein
VMLLQIPRFLIVFFLFLSTVFRTCFTFVENTRYGLYDIDFVNITSWLLHSTICNRVI